MRPIYQLTFEEARMAREWSFLAIERGDMRPPSWFEKAEESAFEKWDDGIPAVMKKAARYSLGNELKPKEQKEETAKEAWAEGDRWDFYVTKWSIEEATFLRALRIFLWLPVPPLNPKWKYFALMEEEDKSQPRHWYGNLWSDHRDIGKEALLLVDDGIRKGIETNRILRVLDKVIGKIHWWNRRWLGEVILELKSTRMDMIEELRKVEEMEPLSDWEASRTMDIQVDNSVGRTFWDSYQLEFDRMEWRDEPINGFKTLGVLYTRKEK